MICWKSVPHIYVVLVAANSWCFKIKRVTVNTVDSTDQIQSLHLVDDNQAEAVDSTVLDETVHQRVCFLDRRNVQRLAVASLPRWKLPFAGRVLLHQEVQFHSKRTQSTHLQTFVKQAQSARHQQVNSFKSRLVLPFRYWFTQAVLEKKPLNGCSSSSSNARGDTVTYI